MVRRLLVPPLLLLLLQPKGAGESQLAAVAYGVTGFGLQAPRASAYYVVLLLLATATITYYYSNQTKHYGANLAIK